MLLYLTYQICVENYIYDRGFFMEPSVYDLTYNDLNPRFLFCCNLLRTEPEMNYHCHDFIEFVFILKGKTTFSYRREAV